MVGLVKSKPEIFEKNMHFASYFLGASA